MGHAGALEYAMSRCSEFSDDDLRWDSAFELFDVGNDAEDF